MRKRLTCQLSQDISTIDIRVGALAYFIDANAMLKSEGTIEVLLCMKGAFDLCR